MATAPRHVIIIGGGIGGLCLAQGLKKRGISVAVYERDRTPDDRLQGYRIHIDPHGNRALQACLPADLFNAYLATSGSAGNGFRITTDQLRELIFFRAPSAPAEAQSAERYLSVSRITLRQVLLSGLEDFVHFGKSFTHYEEHPDDTISAYFADGTSATGDMLVAADGGNSRVRQQFLPHARRVETGVVAVMGKLALTQDVRALLIPGKLDGATSILGPQGRAMFLALHDLDSKPALQADMPDIAGDPAVQRYPSLTGDDLGNYLFWGFIARREDYPHPETISQMDGAALQHIVQQMIATWHPNVRQLVANADPATVIYKPLQTSIPVKQWRTKPITLVGDAIHSMPPTQGSGGNMALHDAQLLVEQLTAAKDGKKSLLQAIHDYESVMIREGFAVVRSSQQALNLHIARSRLMSTLLLRTMSTVMSLPRPGKKSAA